MVPSNYPLQLREGKFEGRRQVVSQISSGNGESTRLEDRVPLLRSMPANQSKTVHREREMADHSGECASGETGIDTSMKIAIFHWMPVNVYEKC